MNFPRKNIWSPMCKLLVMISERFCIQVSLNQIISIKGRQKAMPSRSSYLHPSYDFEELQALQPEACSPYLRPICRCHSLFSDFFTRITSQFFPGFRQSLLGKPSMTLQEQSRMGSSSVLSLPLLSHYLFKLFALLLLFTTQLRTGGQGLDFACCFLSSICYNIWNISGTQ